VTGCDAGSLTGSVGIFPIAGLLCEYGLDGKGFDGGWPAIFYIFGKLALKPNTHRRRRHDSTVELRRVGVGGVNTIRN